MSFEKKIFQAVSILKAGGLVAFPTETVYGLGADAKNPEALRRIFFAKGRPMDHPLIVHLADISQLSQWAVGISQTGKLLAESFWPGPLTLILEKAHGVSDLITGGQNTMGIRVPSHPIAQTLLRSFGSGIAAPSANRFGRISPTSAEAVWEELGESVDLILDGGFCSVGVESTIVDVTNESPVILRPGIITQQQIESVLNCHVGFKNNHSPRVSGSLASHYAPRTKTRLIATEEIGNFLKNITISTALLTRKKISLANSNLQCVIMPIDAKGYAHELYRTLRELDKHHYDQIVIEEVPDEMEWEGIRDRVRRMV